MKTLKITNQKHVLTVVPENDISREKVNEMIVDLLKQLNHLPFVKFEVYDGVEIGQAFLPSEFLKNSIFTVVEWVG